MQSCFQSPLGCMLRKHGNLPIEYQLHTCIEVWFLPVYFDIVSDSKDMILNKELQLRIIFANRQSLGLSQKCRLTFTGLMVKHYLCQRFSVDSCTEMKTIPLDSQLVLLKTLSCITYFYLALNWTRKFNIKNKNISSLWLKMTQSHYKQSMLL